MTSDTRVRALLYLAVGALIALIAAMLSSLEPSKPKAAERVGKVVLAKFESDVTAAEEIKVTTSAGAYSLKREAEGWVLSERGRYPVRLDALADLSEALSSMIYTREMTRDPKKFDRLGLGDPRDDGRGALMEVFNADGEELAHLIVGFKNGAPYIRKPSEELTWAVSASAFPPLQNPARWLDLDVISLSTDDISRVEIEPVQGDRYALEVRRNYPGRFRLAPPYDKAILLADYAPNPPALAMSKFSPLDVKPRSELSGAFAGNHRTITHEGLVVDIELTREDDGSFWATLSLASETDSEEVLAQLEDIETHVAGWAFRLSRLDFNVMTTSLEDIASLKSIRRAQRQGSP